MEFKRAINCLDQYDINEQKVVTLSGQEVDNIS